MKNIFLLLILSGSIISCSETSNSPNGYFKRHYAQGYNHDSQYPFLVRINGDTIVKYAVIDQGLDSSTYLWSRKDSAYFKLREKIPMDNGYNRAAYAVSNNKVVLKIDTTGFHKKLLAIKQARKFHYKTAEEILLEAKVAEAEKGNSMTDTLIRISEKQFFQEIIDQMKSGG